MKRGVAVITVLVVADMISAVAVVQVKHRTRDLFADLQTARVKRDHLNTEWAQLQLENSAWASPDRVVQVARNKLGMIQPHDYVVLQRAQ